MEPRNTPYRPTLAQIKKYEGHKRDECLAGTLTELIFETLRLIERLNSTVTIGFEKRYGREFVGSHSAVETKIKQWIPGNVKLFISCATELAWNLDNFLCLGKENAALSSDSMNGFFVGPKSAAQLIDHLFACISGNTADTESAQSSISQLLSTSTVVHFERHDRLIGQLKRARRFLMDATTVLNRLGEGIHDLQAVLARFSAPSLEATCREALVICAAARLGMTLIGEHLLVETSKLLDRNYGAMRGTKIICPAIMSRRLWVCLLPYVGVDKAGRTLRGTVDQVDWLVTEGYTGAAAGLDRIYGSLVDIHEVVSPIAVVREGHRPSLQKLRKSEMETLQWLIWSAESPLDQTYHRLREVGRAGHGPRSRISAHEWLTLYDQVWSVDSQFAETHLGLSASLALGPVSLVAAAAENPAEFREGLLTRILVTLSCEDCFIETRNGDWIRISRDKEGNVTISSEGTRISELLLQIAARINDLCTRRGNKVNTDLRLEPFRGAIPDFVQSMSVEAFTPAVWVNLFDINMQLDLPR